MATQRPVSRANVQAPRASEFSPWRASRRRLLIGAAGVAASSAVGLGLPARTLTTRAESASFDPMEYGAVGDGAHDDAPAINRAIRAAAEAGGGVVALPVGTFLIGESSVRLSSSVALVGTGYDTLLLLAPGVDASVIMSTSSGPESPTVGASIENLRINGNGDKNRGKYGTGILLLAANECSVQGVWVENTAHSGIFMPGFRNRVSGCHISRIGLPSDNDASGIVFGGDGAKVTYASDGSKLPIGSVAENNVVSDTGKHGIKVYPGGDGSLISGNQISRVADRGIYVQGAPGTVVHKNLVKASGSTGILIGGRKQGADDCTVTGNTIQDASSHGILIWESDHVTVSEGNRTEQNSGCGIYALDSTGVSISDNLCIGNRGNGGIVIVGSPNGQIVSNRCIGNRLAGIYFWDQGDPSTECLVESNRCSDEGWGQQRYGIRSVDGTNALEVTGNDVRGNLARGISLVGSNTVSDNTGGD